MSVKISELVSIYVENRRAMGEKCKTNEAILRSFCRFVGPETQVSKIRKPKVVQFLNGTGHFSNAWHVRHTALNVFFRFAVIRGHVKSAPLPTEIPKRLPTLTPYIYTRKELKNLLGAIPECKLPRRIDKQTMRAMLLLFYGAGLRRQEVLELPRSEVDLPNSLLTIRKAKFFKSRLVPISADLTSILGDYETWRNATYVENQSPFFFIGRDGEGIPWWTLFHSFDRIRKCAGVQRSDGGRYQPRVHDLRHTFAVHRLTEWYRQGADVQRLIYHLSVYLGHRDLAESQVYLTMTPELLKEAGLLFERYAAGESTNE